MNHAQRLFEKVTAFYPENERPALTAQYHEFLQTRPLENLRILDGSPAFLNTQLKYAALLAAGAKLTVFTHELIPMDAKETACLPDFGIRHVHQLQDLEPDYDIVLDCGGVHRHVCARLGYAELTRSGAHAYVGQDAPVFNADDSIIKEFETSLGTGESYARALKQMGYTLDGKKVLVFGYGKVGRGICMSAHDLGAHVCVVDRDPAVKVNPRVEHLLANDVLKVQRAVDNADFIVAVTGHRNALEGLFDAARVCRSSTILANMGVEDEFGPSIPVERVLNGKLPINFTLRDPTRMPYIEPTLCLHNYGALSLLHARGKKGLYTPEECYVQRVYSAVENAGLIHDELRRMNEWKQNQF